MQFEDHVNDYAKKMVGNWKKFESFYWSRSRGLDDASNWCIYYTHHRDSAALARANACVIQKELEVGEFEDDVMPEDHNHWACGWISGFSIRVYKDGKPTKAFEKLCEIMLQLEEYPILDEGLLIQFEEEEEANNV